MLKKNVSQHQRTLRTASTCSCTVGSFPRVCECTRPWYYTNKITCWNWEKNIMLITMIIEIADNKPNNAFSYVKLVMCT